MILDREVFKNLNRLWPGWKCRVGRGRSCGTAITADNKNRQIGIQVRLVENLGMLLGVQCDSPMNMNALSAAKVLKISNGKKPDVGSVVPFIAEDSARLRRPTLIT